MTETFTSVTFLVATLIGIVASGLYAKRAAGFYKVEQANAIKLRTDALLASCNTAITVAGIAAPLLGVLFAYANVQLSQPPASLALLASSLTLIGLSVLVGLWTAFSLAAVGRDQGIFEIWKEKNISLPAYLVMQLSLLFMGTISLMLYLVFGLTANSTPQLVATSSTSHAVLRRTISIGESSSAVQEAWGLPESRLSRPPAIILRYQKSSSTVDIAFENDQVTAVTERKK